jgi:hypothetical protein
MEKEILKRERLRGPLSSVLAGFYSVPAHLRVRAGLPPVTASLSPTAGPICHGRLPPILPLLCARVVTLVKLLLLSQPLVTTSAPQCRHLCHRALEPSHRLLTPCSIASMLPTALLPPVAVPAGIPAPGAQWRSLTQPVPLAELTRSKARRLGPCIVLPHARSWAGTVRWRSSSRRVDT